VYKEKRIAYKNKGLLCNAYLISVILI